jgi:hypothetical protein
VKYKPRKGTEEEIDFCYTRLLQYVPHSVIAREFKIQFKHDARASIAKARERWSEVVVAEKETLRAQAIRSLEQLFHEAHSSKKLALCLTILQEINKLNKLHDDSALTSDNRAINITFAQMRNNKESDSNGN